MDKNSALSLLGFGDSGWGASLLAGTIVTIELALASVLIGLVLGIGLALMKLSSMRVVFGIAEAFTLIIRGIPEFLLLLIVFYSLSFFVESFLATIGFTGFEIPKFFAATVGLSVIFGTYACEVFRGAYLSIERGQIEAARAIGMTKHSVFLRIRLPQIWRYAIPGLGNLWMVLLKDTSLAAVIAVNDVLRVAKVASESTQQPLVFYLAVGCIYLGLTGFSDLARSWLESRARRGI